MLLAVGNLLSWMIQSTVCCHILVASVVVCSPLQGRRTTMLNRHPENLNFDSGRCEQRITPCDSVWRCIDLVIVNMLSVNEVNCVVGK
jgi:hypothetical protein